MIPHLAKNVDVFFALLNYSAQFPAPSSSYNILKVDRAKKLKKKLRWSKGFASRHGTDGRTWITLKIPRTDKDDELVDISLKRLASSFHILRSWFGKEKLKGEGSKSFPLKNSVAIRRNRSRLSRPTCGPIRKAINIRGEISRSFP